MGKRIPKELQAEKVFDDKTAWESGVSQVSNLCSKHIGIIFSNFEAEGHLLGEGSFRREAKNHG